MISISDLPINLRNAIARIGQGAFISYNSNTQSIPNTTSTTLNVGTPSIDVCSWVSSSVYTPKQPGYYLFFGSTYLNIGDFEDGTSVATLRVQKNAGTTNGQVVTQREGVPLTYIDIFEANGTTDYFQLMFWHNAGAAVNVQYTMFGGVFISYNNP